MDLRNFVSLRIKRFQVYGAYPWQAVILTPDSVYQGAGALIDQIHVVTVAHKVADFV